MSLGGSGGSTALQSACNAAFNAGVVLVASAGNSGQADGNLDNISYPAKYPSVVAVGATTSINTRPTWSSTGPALDVVAPGTGVVSDKRGGGVLALAVHRWHVRMFRAWWR